MESTEALPVMFGMGKPSDKKTLETERTRLASAQAEKTELEVQVIKGNLIPSENVEKAVNGMVSAFRAKMLSLPTKAAPSIVVLADASEAEGLLRDYIYEALTELSNYDPDQYRTQSDKKGSGSGSATAETDSKPVGRRKAKTVKRGKRGTRPVEH